MSVDALFHPFAILLLGQLMHALKKLREVEVEGRYITPLAYLKAHPYSVAFSLVAGVVAYAMLREIGQLNTVGAFTAGYMADSVVNTFAQTAKARIGGGDVPRAD